MPHVVKLAGRRLGVPGGMLLGALAFALAFGLGWLAGPEAGVPFAAFSLAVLLTAAFAGAPPALAVLAASLLTAGAFFLPPGPQGAVAVGAYLMVGLAQIALVELLHRAATQVLEGRGRIEKLLAHERHLYHELQHRVANGIQSLASILSIQAERMADMEDAELALKEAVQRLHGVAAVHRRLHDPDLAGEHLADALDGLARDLLRSAGREDVSVDVAVEAPPLDHAAATLVAMIVAEATMNCVKHGFAGRPGGKLGIALHAANDRLVLSVADNGHGVPAVSTGGGPRLGTIIMDGFAQRLDGEFRLENVADGGARVIVEFSPAAIRNPQR